ncbi:hypothetical protein [Kistimonas scapharcae]|uniref:hypothetical protein n=1 Tax=Kistimonas scapharcae TaxID=1036133 RepID=UPI0031E8E5D3
MSTYNNSDSNTIKLDTLIEHLQGIECLSFIRFLPKDALRLFKGHISMEQLKTKTPSPTVSHTAVVLSSESTMGSTATQSVKKVETTEQYIQDQASTSHATNPLDKIDLPQRTCTSEEEALNYFNTWDEINGYQPCPYACEGKEASVEAAIRILVEHLCIGHNHNYPYICNNCKEQTLGTTTLKRMIKHCSDDHHGNTSFTIIEQIIKPNNYPKGIIDERKCLSTHIRQDSHDSDMKTEKDATPSENVQLASTTEAETLTVPKKEKGKRKGRPKGTLKRSLPPESPAERKSSRLQHQESSSHQ